MLSEMEHQYLEPNHVYAVSESNTLGWLTVLMVHEVPTRARPDFHEAPPHASPASVSSVVPGTLSIRHSLPLGTKTQAS